MVYISEYTLLWLLPVVFMLHRFEEMIMVQDNTRDPFEDIVLKLPGKRMKRLRFFTVMSSSYFYATAFVEFAAITLVTLYSAELRRYNMLAAITVFLFLHTFIHLLASIQLKKLTPGIITGLAIIIPYGFKIFMFLTSKDTVHPGAILLNLCILLAVYPPFRNLMQIQSLRKKQ
jgi:hypothetical protein